MAAETELQPTNSKETVASTDPAAEEQRRLELKRRRREQVRYLKTHRSKLEKVAQKCVNQVLLQLPPDPYEALLFQLSAHVKASGLFFSTLRVLPGGPESLVCEVSAIARAAEVMVHRAVLPRTTVARGLAALPAPAAALPDSTEEEAAEPQPMSLEEAEALDTAAVVPRLSAAVGSLLEGLNVLDFQEIHKRLSTAIPPPEEGSAEAATLLQAVLAGELLEAAGRLMDCSAREALRAGILEYGGVDDEQEEIAASQPLTCQQDLEVWQHLWPDLCFPVLQGGTERRGFFLGVTLWAPGLDDAKAAADSADWTLELVDEAAEAARLVAMEDLDLANMNEDEAPEPEPHEFCPAMNAVPRAVELGLGLAAKVGGSGSVPAGEDFAAALAQLRQGVATTMPQYVLNEKNMDERESGELMERLKQTAEAKMEALRNFDSTGNVESDDESVESEKLPNLLIHESQQRRSIYFILHCDADAAYNKEENTYCFAEGEPAKSQAELIDYYAELCEKEPLLRCLIAPLSPSDPDLNVGLSLLRSKLPAGTSIVDEVYTEPEEENELEEVDFERQESSRLLFNEREGIGRLRSLRSSALEPVNQRIKLLKSTHGDGSLALAELGAQGVYDMSQAVDMRLAFGSLIDMALAFPDSSRRFLLPKSGEIKEMLMPLDNRLRSMLLTAYRHKKPTDKRKASKDLNVLQFREGLRRIGYKYTDEYAELLFSFLDQSSNGTLSPSEFQMIELVDGPGSLQDLDELRIWLCEWKARRMEQAEKKRLAAAEGTEEGQEEEVDEETRKEQEKARAKEKKISPLYELWLYMDRDGSGEASFAEFRWALRKARHPAGLNPDKGPALELFMCLDIQVDGSVVEGEFFCLNVLSAYFQLQRVERVKEFLRERFGTLKAAFKYMDEDKSGSLTTEEWMDFMMGPSGYPDVEDIKVCFIFIDKDFSGQLTSKEFEFLGNFDGRDFVADVKSLRDHMVQKYENLDDAYVAFEQKVAPPDLGGIEVSKLSEKKRRRREGRGLSAQDFVNGCRLMGFRGRYDARLYFNFIDAAHTGHITRNEFLQLGKLGAVEALHESSERMRAAIGTLKNFVFKEADVEEPGEPQPDEKWKWAAVHKACRDATHDDLDLMEPPSA